MAVSHVLRYFRDAPVPNHTMATIITITQIWISRRSGFRLGWAAIVKVADSECEIYSSAFGMEPF